MPSADQYETFEYGRQFKPETEEIINTADRIIQEYSADGYTLTLRQLYYQFVSRDLLANTDRNYKRLGNIVTAGRDAGMIPWDGIEDRGRNRQAWLVQEDIDEILADLPYQYAADRWAEQEYYVEVWVEKDALASVVERACRKWRVPYLPCKGYLSASEMWRAGKRFNEAWTEREKTPVVIHLGDHDPSGIDMTRDNLERLDKYAELEVQVERIALNRDQVDQYSPPPNPTKVTDSRAADYIAEHGHTSWELDALEPSVIVDLIERHLRYYIDEDLFNDAARREREQREILHTVRHRWDDVVEFLNGGDDANR